MPTEMKDGKSYYFKDGEFHEDNRGSRDVTLTKEQVEWIQNKINTEKALSDVGRKVRNWVSFVILVGGGMFMFSDNIKQWIRGVVQP